MWVERRKWGRGLAVPFHGAAWEARRKGRSKCGGDLPPPEIFAEGVKVLGDRRQPKRKNRRILEGDAETVGDEAKPSVEGWREGPANGIVLGFLERPEKNRNGPDPLTDMPYAQGWDGFALIETGFAQLARIVDKPSS